MSNIKTYYATGGASTGSSGFTNFTRPMKEGERAKVRAKVFADFPGAVIVNGSDDWDAPQERRPTSVASLAKVEPLAFYHTGISGMSTTGVVVSAENYNRMEEYFHDKFEEDLKDFLKVYREGEQTGGTTD